MLIVYVSVLLSMYTACLDRIFIA